MAFKEMARFKDGAAIVEIDVTATTVRSIRVTNTGAFTLVAQAVNAAEGLRFRTEVAPGVTATRNIPTALRNRIIMQNIVDEDTGQTLVSIPGWQWQCSYVADPTKVASL